MLSIEDPTKFYQEGSDFYKNGKYDEASALFKALVIHFPLEKKYWSALASSLQANHEYESALKAWAMSGILSESDPYPHYHAAKCYIKLNNPEQASKALEQAKAYVSDSSHPLFKKIETYKKIL